MADGIFDFLARDENRMALGLLAQGGDFGRALAGAVQYADQGKANKRKQAHEDLQNQLLQTQMANYQSEIRNRDLAAVRDARRQSWLTDDEPAGAPGGGGSGAAGQPGMPSMPGAPGGMPPGAGGGGAPGGRGGLMGLARELGVDPRLIRTDMALTDGKGITEMLSKRAMPNWQNINGNLVNTNAPGFQGGIQDQVQMGLDGRAMLLRANGGNPVMGAVPGSFDTYSAFKDIDNRTSARYTPGRPVIGADSRMYPQSQLAEVGGEAPRAPAMAPPGMGGRAGPTNAAEQGMAAQVAAVPYDLQREIASVQRDLQGSMNPADRAQATAYLQLLQGQGQAPGATSAAGALDFSPAEKAAQEAAKVRATGTATADVARDTANLSKAKSATENLTNAGRAIELLNQGPTGSGIGEAADKTAAFFGKATQGGNIAAQLDIVSANMVKNVPRFEGPQSNADVEGYKSAAGRVADRSLPIAQRIAAAQEVQLFEKKALTQAGGDPVRAGLSSTAQQQQKPQNLVASLPPANGENKGKRYKDHSTGKVLVSNGLQWKEE